MAGMDVHGTGPGADLKRANDRVLLKMALERKGYQQARKEVRAEDALKTPEVEAQALPRNTSTTIEALELHATRIQVAVENGLASVSVVHIDVQALRIVTQGAQPKRKDPLLLDLDGGGPDTSGAEGAHAFDLEGRGEHAPTSFVQGASAFLTLDRNGNGHVDSGLELFGDQHGAADGFAELARFDANGDGVIDAQDPIFSDLRLLFEDGHQETLAQRGLSRIELDSRPGFELANGDAVLRQGQAYREDGSSVGTYAMGLQQFEA